MKKREEPDWLFSTRWVHVFEEDSDQGDVYRPENSQIPLSRRPRERLELRRDGSASVFTASPDDRLVEQPASWTKEKGQLVVRAKEGGAEVRIVESSDARLVVKVKRGSRTG